MKLRKSFICIALLLSIAPALQARAEIVAIAGGTLSISYDGSVFADVNSSNFGLTPGQDFMRYGRYWAPTETVGSGPNYVPKQPAAFRPLPISKSSGNPRQPNFRDNRAFLDPLYPQTSPTNVLGVNGSGTVAPSEGRNRISTDLAFDTNDVLGTVSGLVQTNGVSAWWFANDDIMNAGASWVSWGDLSLRFDESRIALGYSGWVFANQLGGIGDIFDTKNVSMIANNNGLSLSGEIWGSDGTSSDPYNENLATWESYTLMRPDLKVGTFNFSGITAVPEPSSLVVLIATAGAIAWRRRRSNLQSAAA